MKKSKVLITGGAGFIGSEFVRQAVNKGYNVIIVDKLTYAGDLARLEEIKGKYKFYKTDICNKKGMESVFKKEKPGGVIHFAAESHVDRSIQDASSFIKTNVIGTQILLDASRKWDVSRFIQVSTDEVYGDIRQGEFSEESPINPSSPYSASKAAADCLVNAYVRTYNFPAIIVRPSNNYGPWQYPEKLIPVAIYKGLNNDKIPVYARGLNQREWLYVSDCAQALFLVLRKGKTGQIYNLGSGIEKRNIDVVSKIIKILGRQKSLIQFVKDRPGHDYRYFLNSAKINNLGWNPKTDFERGIQQTVEWYKQNTDWVESKIAYLRSYWKRVYHK